MKHFFGHIRSNILRGFIASIPIFLCYLAVKLLYILIDKKVIGFINGFVEVRQIPGLGILLALLALYLIGVIVSNIVGRQIFKTIEAITAKIPLIKSVYSVGKQLSQSLEVTNAESKAFKKVLLVNLDDNHIWVPGFLTGTLNNENTGEEMYLVFVPTVPNPTTGFVFTVQKSRTIDPGWTNEEYLKVIFSAGIINPQTIKKIASGR